MFERFVEKSIKVLMRAQEESRILGHHYVDTEQILLGIIAEDPSIGAQALKSVGLAHQELRTDVEKIIGHGPGGPPPEGFIKTNRRLFTFSEEEADKLESTYVGTEHLLLGAIRELKENQSEKKHSVALTVLQSHSVDLETLRAKVLELIETSK